MNSHHVFLKRGVYAVALLALLTAAFGFVPQASAQGFPSATVNTGALNVRSGPGVAYGVITSVVRGTVMTMLSRTTDGSWVKVALSNGVQGWVNARYLLTAYPIFNLPIESAGGPTGPTATVATGVLNVRSGPGVSYGVITWLYQGTVVALLTRNADGSWVKVSPAVGIQGWVNARYLVTVYPIVSLPVEGGTVPGQRTYVVQPGENLFRIALRYGVNLLTLAAVNGIANPARIYAGQVLIIP
jgi:uncharacterized protein YgiM (DUF1202 family)